VILFPVARRLATGSPCVPKPDYGTRSISGHCLPQEIANAHFSFRYSDGVRLEDPVGLDCADESDARKTADLIARQIAIDLADGRRDRSVVVLNEAGAEI
jgi:hypothetical protein